MAQVVARTRNPKNDIFVKNLRDFRDFVKMTTEEAAKFSGVSLDSLRRWEAGKTVPSSTEDLHRLGEIYGHAMDDFYLENPPPADLSRRRGLQLWALPGIDAPQHIIDSVQKKIDEANELLRDAKTATEVKPKKPAKKPSAKPSPKK